MTEIPCQIRLKTLSKCTLFVHRLGSFHEIDHFSINNNNPLQVVHLKSVIVGVHERIRICSPYGARVYLVDFRIDPICDMKLQGKRIKEYRRTLLWNLFSQEPWFLPVLVGQSGCWMVGHKYLYVGQSYSSMSYSQNAVKQHSVMKNPESMCRQIVG